MHHTRLLGAAVPLLLLLAAGAVRGRPPGDIQDPSDTIEGVALLRFVDWDDGRAATLYMVQEPDNPEPVQVELEDPSDAEKFVPGARLRVTGPRKVPPGLQKKGNKIKGDRVIVLGGPPGWRDKPNDNPDSDTPDSQFPMLLTTTSSSVKKAGTATTAVGVVQQMPVKLPWMKVLVIPLKVNAYLADGTTINPACPKNGQVYLFTDASTGKPFYGNWTLADLATETVSRDQLRGTFFGPNTLGESVSSMFSDCSYQQTRISPEATRGGSKVMPYIALPCTGNVNGVNMQWNVCDSDNWVAIGASLAQQQLQAQGDSLANYPFKVFLLPNRPADCLWGAVAWANSDQSVHVQALGDAALAPFVHVHELGHTLGLEHAGKGDNVYGDDTAAMGGFPPGGGLSNGGTDRCHNAPHSWQLGWTDGILLNKDGLKGGAANALDVYLPTQSAPSNGQPQVLRVVTSWIAQTASLRVWASYRTKEGGDDDMGAALVGKVHIYTGSINTPNDWVITNWETSLTLGGPSWTHAPTGLVVQFVGLTGKTAIVRLRRP